MAAAGILQLGPEQSESGTESDPPRLGCRRRNEMRSFPRVAGDSLRREERRSGSLMASAPHGEPCGDSTHRNGAPLAGRRRGLHRRRFRRVSDRRLQMMMGGVNNRVCGRPHEGRTIWTNTVDPHEGRKGGVTRAAVAGPGPGSLMGPPAYRPPDLGPWPPDDRAGGRRGLRL